ncbi:ribonuclease YeeF family protein [Bacillus sp. WMMC1349]|uniref:T7SS effector LXG polymorphic toxin n=1 Tax=Bacillus sp. WMMC1349 TaxID=2736254 RepID=UPI00155397F0|nr:T7SS effector LXG polymorphic toxin [Bacillus sp. WMMC1349]NPC93629.1 ribonuclease YeeF family protein [Bacillus sp. WMMC1349]
MAKDKKNKNKDKANELDSSAKVFEASTVIETADVRKKQYGVLEDQLKNLKIAFLEVVNLGDSFTGKGANNIKDFFSAQAEVVDSWLILVKSQIAFFNGIESIIEKHKLSDSYIEMSFLNSELNNANTKSLEIVANLHNNMAKIISDVKDNVDLRLWTPDDFSNKMATAQVTRLNAMNAVDELDKSLISEYTLLEMEDISILEKYTALIQSTSNGKSASPMYFDKKAFHNNKFYKNSREIDKQGTEYIKAKKQIEEAEKQQEQRIKELKEKLDDILISDDEYLKIAEEIGTENLTKEQNQRYASLKFKKMEQEKTLDGRIQRGIEQGTKEVFLDTAKGIRDTIEHPIETLEGIFYTIQHPKETLEAVGHEIKESFVRDVINGDAESRAKWFTYGVGTVALSAAGTKGADKVGKLAQAGKLGKTASKLYKVSKKIEHKSLKVQKKALEKSVKYFEKSKQKFAAKLKGLQLKKPLESKLQFAGISVTDAADEGNLSHKMSNSKSDHSSQKIEKNKEATKSTGKVTEKHEDKNVQKGKHGDGDPKTPHQSKSKPHESVHKVEKPHESNKDAGTVSGKHPHESSKPKKHEPGGDADNGSKGTGDAGTPPRYGERKISDEEREFYRRLTPDDKARDKVNEGLDESALPIPDPVLPGKEMTKRFEPDHIVAYDKIIHMDGFDTLTDKQKREVINNLDNFEGLSRAANGSKQDKTYEEWTHYKKGKPGEIEVNPEFRKRMIKKEKEMERILQKQIDDFNKQNLDKGDG